MKGGDSNVKPRRRVSRRDRLEVSVPQRENRTLSGRWKQRCERLCVPVTPHPDYHDMNCKTYKAAHGPIAIACEHNFDCCPKCDPCTCTELQSGGDVK